MISASQQPLFSCYQVSPAYLRAIPTNSNSFVFLNIHSCNVSFALQKINISKNAFNLISPISFQASIGSVGDMTGLLTEIRKVLAEIGCIFCYIQTRDNLTDKSKDFFSTESFRTNYYFDLSLDYEAMLRSMKADARQRLKKLAKLESAEFKPTPDLREFSEHYKSLAHSRNFNELYVMEGYRFGQLARCTDILYLQQYINGEFSAGGFFGVNEHDVDYLYGVHSPNYQDATRLLLANSFKYFKAAGKSRLFLGGGINENDSLANFKYRQTRNHVRCSSIKMIVNEAAAQKVMATKIDSDIFKGYFPPR